MTKQLSVLEMLSLHIRMKLFYWHDGVVSMANCYSAIMVPLAPM